MKPSRSERIEVFISYAHKDNEDSDPKNKWLDRLMEQLAPLVLQDVVDAWSDQDIGIGEDWHSEIQRRLASAKVAVLLVSSAFLASEYIRNSELPALLQKAKEQGLKILPVILNPCLFQETKFKYPDPKNGPEALSLASLQASGSPKEPLSKLSRYEQDEKLLAVARRIHKLIPANSLESQVRSHSTQSEFIQRIRQEINELLNRQKLRALHDSLLHQAAHPPAKGRSSSPVDRLIPAQEMFSKESPAGGERQLGRHTTVY